MSLFGVCFLRAWYKIESQQMDTVAHFHDPVGVFSWLSESPVHCRIAMSLSQHNIVDLNMN